MPDESPARIGSAAAELLALGIIVWIVDAILLGARGRGEIDPLHLAFSAGAISAACWLSSLADRYVRARSILVVAAIALAWFARFGIAVPSPLRLTALLAVAACCAALAWSLQPRTLTLFIPLALLVHQWLITRRIPGAGPIIAAVILTPVAPAIFAWLNSKKRLILVTGAVAVVLAIVVTFPIRHRVEARAWTGRAEGRANESLPNIVLVVIDTLRADRVGALGYRVRPTTPFIDHLAQHAVVFPRAYSASSWTMPAVASMFTGLSPGAHGVITSDHAIRRDVPTLAESLRKAGYYTTGISANFGLDSEHGYARGFARYTVLWRIIRGTWDAVPSIWDDLNAVLTHYYDEWADLIPDWNWKPHAEDVTRAAIDGVDAAPRGIPLFLYVQYVDPHAPCDGARPGDWHVRPGDRPFDEQWSVEYDREILRLDGALESLVRHLDERLDPARTMVIVVADHGEQLGEGGWRGHGLNLSEATIRVPLLIRFPTGAVPTLDPASPISTQRVFDLALDAAGIRRNWTIEAFPQSSLVQGNTMLRSVTDGRHKFVQSWDLRSGQVTREQLFELPDESHDLSAAQSGAGASLRAVLSSEPMPLTTADVLSDEARAKFRALGYLH
jgi:arylsulfatase A-like enzyme